MGFWYCQWELSFDIANENLALNIASKNWILILPMKIGFDVANENWDLNIANENWALDKQIAMGLNHGLWLYIWILLIKLFCHGLES